MNRPNTKPGQSFYAIEREGKFKGHTIGPFTCTRNTTTQLEAVDRQFTYKTWRFERCES